MTPSRHFSEIVRDLIDAEADLAAAMARHGHYLQRTDDATQNPDLAGFCAEKAAKAIRDAEAVARTISNLTDEYEAAVRWWSSTN